MFQFRCLSFGLNIAPRLFTKLTKPILKQLRLAGVQVVAYLDVWLIWASSREEYVRVTQLVETLLYASSSATFRIVSNSEHKFE